MQREIVSFLFSTEMEETVGRELRQQQRRERRLGDKARAEVAAPEPLLQPADGALRHILPPRAPSPQPVHEQFLAMRELAREDREHSEDRPVPK